MSAADLAAGVDQPSGDPRFSAKAVRAAYNTVAEDYTTAFADDLARLPVDRAVLDAVAEALCPEDLVLDLGCGPAPASSYLRAQGVTVVAADLSGGMLAAAGRRNSGLPLVQADMRRLPIASASLGAVVAYYSLQHLPRGDFGPALGEIGRVLCCGGILALATHLGAGERYIEDFLGHRIEPVGGCLYDAEEIVRLLAAAGFVIDRERRREPLAHETDTERLYLVASLGLGAQAAGRP